MVEAAFHHPVAALEREHPLGLELFPRQAAEQKNHFPAPFLFLGLRVLAFDASLQSRRQPSSRKTHLRGSHFLAAQAADFQTAAVVFPLERPGPVVGRRGKNAVG